MLSLFKRLFGGGRKPRGPARPIRRAAPHSRDPSVPKAKPTGVDLLDNPDLSVEPAEDTGFDPYNTGTFNRSGSWERINKRRNG